MLEKLPDFEISIFESLSDIDKADWDRLANPLGLPFDPFISWDFLQALEESGSASARTGWGGRHLMCKDAAGQVIGYAPVWLKTHSQGEYIFDHAFADAWHRAGGQWYPKLTSAVPFTPVPGRRLLSLPGVAGAPARAAMLSALEQMASQSGLATAQINFPSTEDIESLEQMGWLIREDRQFHFFNKGYTCFDDFLSELSSDKRKNLRKERARAQAGLEILRLSGDQITEVHWDFFFKCYIDTGDRKWGTPYLNRKFFTLLGQRMADHLVLIIAKEGERFIAAALNFLGGEALYGRWWGRLEDRPFLHFELCYYQAIDEAIARGLSRVEAGAQGGHKLARGYVPVSIWQGSWVANPGLRAAIADFLVRERKAMAEDTFWLNERTPFKVGSLPIR
jgi:predicted N-acyltransferase